MKTLESTKIRQLNFDKDGLTFRFLENEQDTDVVLLKLGYLHIAHLFFKQNVPTELETDYAINYIEDELMSLKKLENLNQEVLITDDAYLKEILLKNGRTKSNYTNWEIENLFSEYARVVMGAALTNLPVELTREDFALVLVLREIMHHLKFDSIEIRG
ncbi:hypothetical protein EP331_15980 [bacterium]|nr:MAG: hypothetical protein EP331_15980 [bacterium]